MPRLLRTDALDGPPVRARWTAILAAALALTAWHTDWAGAWDAARGLAPAQTERHDWNAADLDDAFDADPFPGDFAGLADPAAARTAQLRAEGVLLDLVWDSTLSITNVRVELYDDAFGAGHRLAVAMDSTTADGVGCLNASLTPAAAVSAGRTTLQACSRADRLEQPGEPTDRWRPDHLFVTQTANLDPADDTALVDYLGLGLHLGDSDETGMWGPNWWSPMMGGQYHDCDDPTRYALLEDLHLRPEYAIHTEHRGAPTTVVAEPVRVAPEPGGLYVPACVPVNEHWSVEPRTGQAYATDPYLRPEPSAFAAWTRYNAARAEPGPLHTVVAFDVRSCDTAIAQCTGDDIAPQNRGNGGRAAEWMSELLHAGA